MFGICSLWHKKRNLAVPCIIAKAHFYSLPSVQYLAVSFGIVTPIQTDLRIMYSINVLTYSCQAGVSCVDASIHNTNIRRDSSASLGMTITNWIGGGRGHAVFPVLLTYHILIILILGGERVGLKHDRRLRGEVKNPKLQR
jgi:hypothetical protein